MEVLPDLACGVEHATCEDLVKRANRASRVYTSEISAGILHRASFSLRFPFCIAFLSHWSFVYNAHHSICICRMNLQASWSISGKRVFHHQTSAFLFFNSSPLTYIFVLTCFSYWFSYICIITGLVRDKDKRASKLTFFDRHIYSGEKESTWRVDRLVFRNRVLYADEVKARHSVLEYPPVILLLCSFCKLSLLCNITICFVCFLHISWSFLMYIVVFIPILCRWNKK